MAFKPDRLDDYAPPYHLELTSDFAAPALTLILSLPGGLCLLPGGLISSGPFFRLVISFSLPDSIDFFPLTVFSSFLLSLLP